MRFTITPFLKRYFTVLLAVLVLFTVCVLTLTFYLSAYENSQSYHVAKEEFTRYFKKGKYEDALKKAGYEAGETENLKTVAKAIKEQAKTKVFDLIFIKEENGIATYHVVLSAPTYVKEAAGKEFVGGDIKVAQMRFEKSEKKNFWGFASYEFLDMQFFFRGDLTITCAIPATYTLLVNGTAAEDSAIASTEEHPFNSFLPENKEGITLKIYEFSDFFLEPTLVCQNEEGKGVEMAKNEETGRWEMVLPYESEVDQALKDQLLSDVKEYAKYLQKDTSLSTLTPCLVRGGPFYQKAVEYTFVRYWDHENYLFRNEEITDFFFYDQETLTCHVSFDQVLQKSGKEDYVLHHDYTVFAQKEGGAWRLYSFAS